MIREGSQNSNIAALLVAGVPITALTAARDFDCYALPQRIKELRDMGFAIQCTMKTTVKGKRTGVFFITAADRDAAFETFNRLLVRAKK